jgi:WD40 repeat protein
MQIVRARIRKIIVLSVLSILLFPTTIQSQEHSTIQGMDWNASGNRLAVGNLRGVVTIIDYPSLERSSFEVEGVLDQLAWSPADDNVLAVMTHHTVQIWDLSRGDYRSFEVAANELTSAISWHPDGNSIAASIQQGGVNYLCCDYFIRIWDVESETLIHEFEIDSIARAIGWSHDASLFAASAHEQGVLIWNTDTWEIETQFASDMIPVLMMAWSPIDNRIAVGGGRRENSRLWIYDIETERQTMQVEAGSIIYEIVWSPDASDVAFTTVLEMTIYQIEPVQQIYSDTASGVISNAIAWSSQDIFAYYDHETMDVELLEMEDLPVVNP